MPDRDVGSLPYPPRLLADDFQRKGGPPDDEGKDRIETREATARVEDAFPADVSKGVFHKSGAGETGKDLGEVIGMNFPFLGNDLDEAASTHEMGFRSVLLDGDACVEISGDREGHPVEARVVPPRLLGDPPGLPRAPDAEAVLRGRAWVFKESDIVQDGGDVKGLTVDGLPGVAEPRRG